jgi:hypothetical protein
MIGLRAYRRAGLLAILSAKLKNAIHACLAYASALSIQHSREDKPCEWDPECKHDKIDHAARVERPMETQKFFDLASMILRSATAGYSYSSSNDISLIPNLCRTAIRIRIFCSALRNGSLMRPNRVEGRPFRSFQNCLA